MATVTKPINDVERAQRADEIAEAVASIRLEGLEPSPEATAIFARYVSGDLSMDETSTEIQALNARRARSVPVPRD
jgi:hypothetical protein